MNEIEDNIRRSDEIQDIIGRTPSWIVRWGSILVFSFFVVLLFVAIILRYPDIISGNIIITCQNPPADLVSRSSGRINFLVKENQAVKRNDYIAFIENTADLKEMIKLKNNLGIYQTVVKDPLQLITNPIETINNNNLGEVQDAYNDFIDAIDKYKLFINLQKNIVYIKSCRNQIRYLQEDSKLLVNKKRSFTKEFLISERHYREDSILYWKKAISKIELDKSESLMIKSQNDLHNLEEDIITNQKEIEKLKYQINDLFIVDKDEKMKLEFMLKSSYKILKTVFLQWQQKYIISAPIEGKTIFYDFWNNNQYVKEGEEVAHVISGSDNIFGKLYVKGKGFGKVKVGQKVRIALDNYPIPQYGVIFGRVKSISDVNKNNMYILTISLPNGLVTNYKNVISFRHEMNGTGEVITENLNIIERIFYQSRSLLTKYRD